MTQRQEAIKRLAAALSHWQALPGLSTRSRIKSVANRFGVHPKSLEEGIRLLDLLSPGVITASK